MDPISEPASGRQGFTRSAAVVSPRAEPVPTEPIENEEEIQEQPQIKRKNYHKNK